MGVQGCGGRFVIPTREIEGATLRKGLEAVAELTAASCLIIPPACRGWLSAHATDIEGAWMDEGNSGHWNMLSSGATP